MAQRGLFPPIHPYNSGQLPVSDGHRIYFEESGRKDGLPVLFLHGGPGGGTSPVQRRFFDPKAYRIILFDQRGCGQSEPHGSLEANTTWHLLDDIEALRAHLGIDKWLLFGGSWGSTLALLYAQAHPDRALGLILRGVFLMQREEIDWFYREGTNAIFPEAWEDFIRDIPEAERDDLVEAYYRRLTGPDQEEQLVHARNWCRWEAESVTLKPRSMSSCMPESDRFAFAFARIECHYFKHGGFLSEDRQILKACPRIEGLPVHIVQGRYDAICPPRSAWRLKQALPNADLRIVPVAGHSAFETHIVHELVAATNRFRDRLTQ